MNELKNYYNKGRTILKDVLPLDIPLCVSIEPTNICNFKCTMCFHGNNEYAEEAKPLKNMDMNCFEKILDDLKSWQKKVEKKIKLIKLYSIGEPLVHANICEMVTKIKEANICEQIEITTNASLLNSDIAKQLVDSGLDILRISVYGAYDSSMSKITKSKFKVEDIVNNVKLIKQYRDSVGSTKPVIIAKMLDTYTEENKAFIDMFSLIVDEVGIDQLFHLTSGDNDVFINMYEEKANEAFEKSMATNVYTKHKACRYPFTHLTIKSDGTCVCCCADWLKELKFGNVMESSLEDVWNSKELYDIRCKMLVSKGAMFDACRYCEIPLRDSIEDNIDDFPIEKLSYRIPE